MSTLFEKEKSSCFVSLFGYILTTHISAYIIFDSALLVLEGFVYDIRDDIYVIDINNMVTKACE